MKQIKQELQLVLRDSEIHSEQLKTEALTLVMKPLQCGKAGGFDGISDELLLHFWMRPQKWLFDFFLIPAWRQCTYSGCGEKPKCWLYPNHLDTNSANIYHPIFLFC